MDFWGSRVQSAKHFSAVQAARLGNSDSFVIMDEEEDDVRAWFPCPFCYVEIELPVLCIHLQEEHCFDLKNAVCPICAATLGKDAIGHFTVQHAHSVKIKQRRRKSQKSGLSAMIGKDFRDLAPFLGSNTLNSRHNTQDPAPDPLLSPFLRTAHVSEPKDTKLDMFSSTLPTTSSSERSKPSLPDPLQELDYEERMKRAAFFQELVLSTIFF